MKKSIYSIFDDMKENFDEVDLTLNADVDCAAVKNDVFSHLGLKKNNKFFGKKFKLTVIAATIAVVLMVGTTAINANGGIELIKEFFTGIVSSSDLYNGGNVEITTPDPNLDIQLLAVTGDKNNFYAVIQIEKKDGTPFTDENYIYMPNNSNSYLMVSCKDQSRSFYPGVTDGGISKKYHLTNNGKTLNIFISMDISQTVFRDFYNSRNAIMTVQCESLGFGSIKEKIAVCDKAEAESYLQIVEMAKQKGITDFTWFETSEGVIYCTYDIKEYEIPFEITFSMKHNTDNTIQKNLSENDVPHLLKNNTKNVKMEISPFDIRISCDGKRLSSDSPKSDEMIWYLPDLCFERVSPDNSKIILDDGKEYYFSVIPSSREDDQDSEGNFPVHAELKLTYSIIPNPTYTVENVVIDTGKIKQIIINGDTVYEN